MRWVGPHPLAPSTAPCSWVTLEIVFDHELRIVDSLRPYSTLDDATWQIVRKEIERKGVEASSVSARRALASAMLKAQAVRKGDYVGHPFRGNQWTDSSGAGRDSSASGIVRDLKSGDKSAKAMLVKRPEAVRVKTVEEAIKRMANGEIVELEDDRQVNTLLKELHKMVNEAKERGEKVRINLCNVSVKGTNVFCGQSLADADGKPLPRAEMPQLSGTAREGTEAAKIANKKGEVDAGPAFLKFLKNEGVDVTEEKVPAASLKASQAELKSDKVAGIMDAKKWDSGTIYVSKDNYVIDGHHRWAAAVGADSEDGLGDLKVEVVRVDMTIAEALQVANAFTDEFGIGKEKF